MDEHTISPAGDPFYAAPRGQDERPCVCFDGWVFLGCLGESEHDLDGEVEVIEAVPTLRGKPAMIELLAVLAAYLIFSAVSLAATIAGYALGAWLRDRL